MKNLANKPITFLSLLRKYNGNIKIAHELEMKAAVRALPEGTNSIAAYFQACSIYKKTK